MSSLSGSREMSGNPGDDKFRVPVPLPVNIADSSPSNWLQQQTFIDGSTGGRHFSSWERTTQFGNQAMSSLITTVEQTTLNGNGNKPVPKPVLKPIPSRLGSPLTMVKYEPKMFQDFSPHSNNGSIKLETSGNNRSDEEGVDSAFEDDSGCSRTTPVNHKSIRKWRQLSQPAGGNRARNSSGFQPISIHTSSPYEDSISGPLSAPSNLHHWTNNRPGSSSGGSAGSNSNGSFAFSPRDSLYASPTGLSFRDSFDSSLSRSAPKCETITSPEHLDVSDESVRDQTPSIPVGIAVARQRERENSPFTKSDMDMMMPPAPGKLSQDLYARPPPAHHQPLAMSPWQSLPFTSDAFSHHQSALAASLPLGYQLAKDPLTGQVFFVPGAAFAAAAAFSHHTQLLWPPPSASMPPPPPPPPLSPSPFHQSLLQLQQETWLARHQFFYNNSHSPLAQMVPSVPTPPPAHQRSSEPITTLRVPTSAAVASLISSEKEKLHRPQRLFKEETPDREVKQKNFLVDNLCRASNSVDHHARGVTPEVSDDRISVGSFTDEVKYAPVLSESDGESLANSHGHRHNVKTERRDSCDSVTAVPQHQEVEDQSVHKNEQPQLEATKQDVIKREPARSGLDLLAEGIERMEKLSTSKHVKRPRLSSTPPRGARHTSVDGEKTPGGLHLLCDVALMSDVEEEERKSPKVRSRSLDSHMSRHSLTEMIARNYSSPKAEQNAKAFIASKSVRVADMIPLEVESNNTKNADSSWKMGTWEKNVRQNIANIQRKYKEKYKELYRLQHISNKKQQQQQIKIRRSSETNPSKKIVIKSEKPEEKQDSSFWMKKSKNGESNTPISTSTQVRWEIKNKQDLSDITSKFKSSRPNPFENLLRLSAHKSSPKPEPLYSSTPKIFKPTPTATLVGKVTAVSSTSPLSSSSVDLTNSTEKSRHSSPPRKSHQHHHHRRVMEAIVIKKPSEEKFNANSIEHGTAKLSLTNIPKLLEFNEVTNVNLDDEEDTLSPPVLEPMTETKAPLTFKISKKSESSTVVEENELLTLKSKKSKKYKKNKKEKRKEKKLKKENKMKVVVDDEESCDAITDKDHHDVKPLLVSSHKKKKSKKLRVDLNQGPSSCVIKESDLTEGLRVLIKLEGHFYPGQIQAISPPDIYGVLVDRERGNKPHIFSREEVLQDAIFEVHVPSSENLSPGTRVCAYWSPKYHHLYPGTVSDSVTIDPKLDSNFVNIELDDGDSRDIHFENIRFLPPDYPLVEYDPDPMASLTKRKRRHSFESTTSEGSRATKTPRSSIDERNPTCLIQRSPIADKAASCIVRFPAPTESQRSLWASAASSHNSSQLITPPKKKLKLRVNLAHARKDKLKDKLMPDEKSGITAFLHPQQLWRWSGSGVRRPRSRRITHQEIEREEDESLCVGDCAVFLSTGRPDRPYVGRIEALWESVGGHMRVKVRWFYHAVETEGCASGGRRVDELTMPGALFESNHFDENDVQTISHRCEVLSFKAYKRIMDSEPKRIDTIYENNDLYYLAGEYDPIVGTIRFERGVLGID